jgi:hypothetical protein
MNLVLRPTIIADEKLPNDYCVIHDGRSIGRIRLAHERSWQGTIWVWHVNPPLPIPPWCNGSAGSLEVAKTEFKAAWERFYSLLMLSYMSYYNGARPHLSLNKRRADITRRRASWTPSLPSDPGRTASPICPDLICGRHSWRCRRRHRLSPHGGTLLNASRTPLSARSHGCGLRGRRRCRAG